MADLNGIGNLLQGVGAGFSGQLPQLMYARQQQQEADALADDRRRQALMRDFVTGYSLLNSGQVDQAKTLFTNRLDMLKKLKAPDMSDTQAIVDRLNAGKVDEVTAELGSFVQAGMATGDLKLPSSEGGMASAKTRQFVDGTVQMVLPTGQVQVILPNGQPVQGEDARAALQQAMQNEVSYAGQKSGAMAGAAGQQRAAWAYPTALNTGTGQNAASAGAGGGPSDAELAAATTNAQEGAKADVTRDTQARVNTRAGDTLGLSSGQVMDAFSKVNTGPIWGRVPAAMRDSTAYQTAEAAAGGYRAQMRKIVRPPGSGPWTDVDEQKLDAIVPNLTDTFETVQAKLNQGQQLYDAQMGKTPGGNPMEGKTAVNPTTGQKIRMVNGQWVPL